MSNARKIAIAPYLKKEKTTAGQSTIDTQGAGLDVFTPMGDLGISYDKSEHSSGSQRFGTKEKKVTYKKQFDVGSKGNKKIRVEGQYGKSENPGGKITTKGGKITFVYQRKRGGDVMPARNKKNFRPTKAGAGMTRAGVAAYRRANPGSKLKTAVTGKVKPGSKAAKRRKSFCARSAGQMKKFPKAAKDPNSRLRQARRRWRC